MRVCAACHCVLRVGVVGDDDVITYVFQSSEKLNQVISKALSRLASEHPPP